MNHTQHKQKYGFISVLAIITLIFLLTGCSANENDEYKQGCINDMYAIESTGECYIVVLFDDGTEQTFSIDGELFDILHFGNPVTVWEDGRLSIG